MRRAYQILLQTYPRDYKLWFATEMLSAFDQSAQEHRRMGWSVYVRFVLPELIGLALGAAAEWMAKYTTTSSIRGRCLPDVQKMRPTGVPRELWFTGHKSE